MRTTTLLSLITASTLLTGCGAVPVDETSQATYAANDLYTKLKQLEAMFPAPPPSATIGMGAFDASSGAFHGLVSQTEVEIDPILHKPHQITIPATATIQAVDAVLSFSVQNRGGLACSVTVNNVVHSIPTGQSSFTVDIGRADPVDWRIACGSSSYSDKIVITRDVHGVGAFTVRAWPISLLYEPPQNQAKTNWAAYTNATQRSTADTISTSSDQSTGNTNFGAIHDLVGAINKVASVTPLSDGISKAMGAVNTLLGTESTTITNGTTVTSDHTLEFSTATTSTQRTTAHLGPGLGDIVGYLENARFAWAFHDNQLMITLIDFNAEVYRPMVDVLDDLQSVEAGGAATKTGLDQVTLESLVALDPLAHNSFGFLPAGRYDFVKTLVPSGEITSGVSYTTTTTDKDAHTTYHSKVVESDEGWLSKLGLGEGVTDDGTTKTTVTEGGSHTIVSGTTVQATFDLSAQPGEGYSVDVYFDKIFNTFMFRPTPRPRPFPPVVPVGPVKAQ
jgi:hypothetical protein